MSDQRSAISDRPTTSSLVANLREELRRTVPDGQFIHHTIADALDGLDGRVSRLEAADGDPEPEVRHAEPAPLHTRSRKRS